MGPACLDNQIISTSFLYWPKLGVGWDPQKSGTLSCIKTNPEPRMALLAVWESSHPFRKIQNKPSAP